MVHAGDKSFSTTIPAGKRHHTFKNLQLPGGQYSIRVTTEKGKAVPGLHQLHLIQSP